MTSVQKYGGELKYGDPHLQAMVDDATLRLSEKFNQVRNNWIHHTLNRIFGFDVMDLARERPDALRHLIEEYKIRMEIHPDKEMIFWGKRMYSQFNTKIVFKNNNFPPAPTASPPSFPPLARRAEVTTGGAGGLIYGKTQKR